MLIKVRNDTSYSYIELSNVKPLLLINIYVGNKFWSWLQCVTNAHFLKPYRYSIFSFRVVLSIVLRSRDNDARSWHSVCKELRENTPRGSEVAWLVSATGVQLKKPCTKLVLQHFFYHEYYTEVQFNPKNKNILFNLWNFNLNSQNLKTESYNQVFVLIFK